MNTNAVFRISFYVMLTIGTAILCDPTSDSAIDRFLPYAVMVAGIFAYLTVDRHGKLGIPRDVGNLLAGMTLIILFLECRPDDSIVIRCLGHWLVYLQLIKYFLPKTTEDDWFLFLLGLTQVLIGSVINQVDFVGAWLFLWAMLAVWVLGLFFLDREARRFQAQSNPVILTTQPRSDDPYHGLLNIPYLFATMRMLAFTLVLGGAAFLLLPRQAGATREKGNAGMAKHLTGFDEEVKLGQLGEILENDSVVMSVEFSNFEKTSSALPTAHGEPLWRGVTLSQYENGRWRRNLQRSHQIIVSPSTYKPRLEDVSTVVRQSIHLEPNDSTTLFALRPIVEWSTPDPQRKPQLNPIDATLFRTAMRGGYDYEILSFTNPEAPQQSEHPPSGDQRRALLTVPPGIVDRIRSIAEPLVADLPNETQEDIAARAKALEAYLRDSGKFGYTLEMNVIDSQLDPVEDFLINRQRGHCEYFASALALMLRSVGIPSRIINGFKGGDWNGLTQSMNVRQKHAHSWVEAYVGDMEVLTGTEIQRLPRWITLDPTPGIDRAESVAQVGGFFARIRQVTDMVRYVWVFYVLGYDSARQQRMVYKPIRALIGKARDGAIIIWAAVKSGFANLFAFQSIGSFISIRGFFVSFIVLTFLAFLGKFLIWCFKRLVTWWRGPIDDTAGLTAGILFYRRLAQLLSEFELKRPPTETQSEFATRASRFLVSQVPQSTAVAEVPRNIVDAFYQVRFGQRELDPETLESLEEQLDQLQGSLGQLKQDKW